MEDTVPKRSEVQGRKWLLLIGIFSTAALAAAGLEFAAASIKSIGGYALPALFIGTIVFNIVAALAAWPIARTARRIFLRGRFPFAIGVAKLVVLITLGILLTILIGAMAIGAPPKAIAVRAFILGLVGSGVFFLAANGLLSSIIVVRHSKGTLAETSKPV